MGNTVSFKYYDCCNSIVYEKKINRTIYSSLFELGDLEKIKASYADSSTPINIRVFDKKTSKTIHNMGYKTMKKRQIVFVVESKDKDINEEVMEKIKDMTQWKVSNKYNIHIRPRLIVKLPISVYYELKGWRGNGIKTLEKTEHKQDAKIIYLKKKQKIIICSNSMDANRRIADKLSKYKKHYTTMKRNN